MSNDEKIVAVVDDDPEIRASMARLLSASGYSAKTFDSAETFLACASTSKASCLVVDVELGGISGIDLARRLATDNFNCPIIFMTGRSDEMVRRQAADADGIAFLSKPFPGKMLIDAIKRAIG